MVSTISMAERFKSPNANTSNHEIASIHVLFFFFKYTATTVIYTLSLHDALPICAEFTENIINGVERPVKAAELFAFTLRVRAGNTDVLTDAEENVRQKLRAEGVM